MTVGDQDGFAGKVAIVTGGGAGMGMAFARALAARGVSVGIPDIDNTSAKDLAGELTGQGLAAIPIAA